MAKQKNESADPIVVKSAGSLEETVNSLYSDITAGNIRIQKTRYYSYGGAKRLILKHSCMDKLMAGTGSLSLPI